MNVADLFITLGIKGADKTHAALQETNTSLGGIKDTSLAAKAAILGAMYAVERFMSSAIQSGNALVQFSNYTGMSMDTLQRWEYLLRQSLVPTEEAAASFTALQKVMFNLRAGLAAPEGAPQIRKILGSSFDWQRAKYDMAYMMDSLREYARLEKDIPLRNHVLESFGLVGQGMIGALATSKVDLSKISPGELVSDRTAKGNQKAGVAWANTWHHVQVALMNFNAKHGVKLASDIGLIADKVLLLSNSFLKLAENLKVFEFVGDIFKGWAMLFDVINNSMKSVDEKFDNKKGALQSIRDSGYSPGQEAVIDYFKNTFLRHLNNWGSPVRELDGKIKNKLHDIKKPEGINKNQNVSINIHGVEGAEDIIPELKRFVSDAMFQNGTLMVG